MTRLGVHLHRGQFLVLRALLGIAPWAAIDKGLSEHRAPWRPFAASGRRLLPPGSVAIRFHLSQWFEARVLA